jgi:hypothetical protein
VGTLFIFSGIIKANDPLGFSYKLEEYWVEFGIAWDWLLAIGVPLASLICILEIALGVAVLVAYRMNIVTRLLLAMMVFFTILTFASAVFGLVKTCGCFGDAIPLTPWQSFIKDVVLMVLIIIFFTYKREFKPQDEQYKGIAFIIFPVTLLSYASFKVDWNFPMYFALTVLGIGFIASLANNKHSPMITTLLALVGSIWLCVQSIEHLPMKDFRPYAVGKSLTEQMKLPEGAKAAIYENVFLYRNKSTGKVEEFNESSYPWDDDNFEFVDRTTSLIEKGDEAKITDFSIVAEDGYDLTEDILGDPSPIIIMICYNISEADQGHNAGIKSLIEASYENGISIIGLSASDPKLVQAYLEQASFDFPFYSTDEITLKTIVRSNPGFILLKEGTVLGKWHVNDTPDIATIKALI